MEKYSKLSGRNFTRAPTSGIMVKHMVSDTIFKAVDRFSVRQMLLGVRLLAAKRRSIAKVIFCPGIKEMKCSCSKKRMSMLR